MNIRVMTDKYLYVVASALLLLLFVVANCTVTGSPLLAIGGTGVLAAGALLVWRPWLLLLLTFAGAGLPSLLIPVPGHTVRPAELGILLCLGMILWLRPPVHLKFPHVCALLFLAYACVVFIHVPEFSTVSVIYGANKRLYNLLIILVALFCGTFLVRTIKDISAFLSIVLLSNLPLFLVCLAQLLRVVLPTYLSPANPAAEGDAGRLVGPFDGAATFGIYLAGLLAVALACWLLGERLWHRRVGLIMVVLTLLTLVGSGTRSALVAGIVICILALLMTGRIRILLISLLASLLGLFSAFDAIIGHFNHAETSTSNRVFLWGEALKLIASHPLLGIGMEQFHHYYNRLILSQSTQLNQNGISVHNQYLEWAMEGGIPWFVLGVLFLVSVVVVCGRGYRATSGPERMPMLAASLAAFATMLMCSLDVPMNYVEGGVFLCLLAGLALGYMGRYKPIHHQG